MKTKKVDSIGINTEILKMCLAGTVNDLGKYYKEKEDNAPLMLSWIGYLRQNADKYFSDVERACLDVIMEERRAKQ